MIYSKEQLKRLSKNELVRIIQNPSFLSSQIFNKKALVDEYHEVFKSETHIRALAFRVGYYAGYTHLALHIGAITKNEFIEMKNEILSLADEQRALIRKKKGRKCK